MNWLKQNWFKLGILLIGSSSVVIIYQTLITVPQREDLKQVASEPILVDEEIPPRNIEPLPEPKNSSTIDPALKIERCKADATITAKEYWKEVLLNRSKDSPPIGCDTGNETDDSRCLRIYLITLMADSDYVQQNAYDEAYLNCLNG